MVGPPALEHRTGPLAPLHMSSVQHNTHHPAKQPILCTTRITWEHPVAKQPIDSALLCACFNTLLAIVPHSIFAAREQHSQIHTHTHVPHHTPHTPSHTHAPLVVVNLEAHSCTHLGISCCQPEAHGHHPVLAPLLLLRWHVAARASKLVQAGRQQLDVSLACIQGAGAQPGRNWQRQQLWKQQQILQGDL